MGASASVADRNRAADSSSVDGRVQRGARSRDAIVAALFQLIGSGVAQPTAERVAELAGVRVRTVFRHFVDMESLHAELSTRLQEEVRPLFDAAPVAGALDERVRAFIRTAAQVYEHVTPYKRSNNTRRWRHRYMQKSHDEMLAQHRAHLLKFLPELSPPAAAQSPLCALELVTSFEAWDRLRSQQKLGVERARATMEFAALALVARPEDEA
jgi:AcrR family transcriptional regulator